MRVVVVAVSALLVALVAFTSGEPLDVLRGDRGSNEACSGDGRVRRPRRTPVCQAVPHWLNTPRRASPQDTLKRVWAARRRRVRELLRAGWELASGRVVWRTLLLARAGKLRRPAGGVARTDQARVCVSG